MLLGLCLSSCCYVCVCLHVAMLVSVFMLLGLCLFSCCYVCVCFHVARFVSVIMLLGPCLSSVYNYGNTNILPLVQCTDISKTLQIFYNLFFMKVLYLHHLL